MSYYLKTKIKEMQGRNDELEWALMGLLSGEVSEDEARAVFKGDLNPTALRSSSKKDPAPDESGTVTTNGTVIRIDRAILYLPNEQHTGLYRFRVKDVEINTSDETIRYKTEAARTKVQGPMPLGMGYGGNDVTVLVGWDDAPDPKGKTKLQQVVSVREEAARERIVWPR